MLCGLLRAAINTKLLKLQYECQGVGKARRLQRCTFLQHQCPRGESVDRAEMAALVCLRLPAPESTRGGGKVGKHYGGRTCVVTLLTPELDADRLPAPVRSAGHSEMDVSGVRGETVGPGGAL
ncbi:hypothetical protein CB1_000146013 [Camelus ferus]|nr:hypothetical protein CB1_000146013 [Camelus ferus]